MGRLAVIFCISMIIYCVNLYAEGGWVTLSDEENVKGYSRTVDGSNILEYRSTIVVDSKIEIVGAVLRNVNGLKEDNKNCIELRFLEKKDNNNYTFYIAYSYSGPIANRDIIVKVTTRYDLKRGRVISDLTAVSEPLVPYKKGFVRITDYRAQFVIEYINREKTGVIFTSRMNPGGSIPAFIVNYMGKRAIFSGAADLREAVKKQKYIDAANGSKDVQIVESVVGNRDKMRTILRNRLGEYIRDDELVKIMTANNVMYDKLCRGDGEVNEIILHGWGSYESRRRAVDVLLSQYLRLFINDGKKVEDMIRSNDLVTKALAGIKCADTVRSLTGKR